MCHRGASQPLPYPSPVRGGEGRLHKHVGGHFCSIFRSICALGTDFLEHLRSRLRSAAIFATFHRFFMDLGRIFGKLLDDFSLIFQFLLENTALRAVFRTSFATSRRHRPQGPSNTRLLHILVRLTHTVASLTHAAGQELTA